MSITIAEFKEDALSIWRQKLGEDNRWYSRDTVEWDHLEHTGFDTRVGHAKPVDVIGGENCGSQYFIVFRIEETDQYIRVQGVYDSWDGMSWWSPIIDFVKPKVVSRVEYETVEED